MYKRLDKIIPKIARKSFRFFRVDVSARSTDSSILYDLNYLFNLQLSKNSGTSFKYFGKVSQIVHRFLWETYWEIFNGP